MREKTVIDLLFEQYMRTNSDLDLRTLYDSLNPWLYEITYLSTRDEVVTKDLLIYVWEQFQESKNGFNMNEYGIDYLMYLIIRNNKKFWS